MNEVADKFAQLLPIKLSRTVTKVTKKEETTEWREKKAELKIDRVITLCTI